MRGLALGGALAVALVSACTDPGSTSSGGIDRHHAIWTAQAPPRYQFEYRFTGFFLVGVNELFLVSVRHDTVEAAVNLATGQQVTGSLAQFPTIEQLFDRAAQAQQSGSLSAIAFDATLGYPLRMDIAGPPDAGGSVFVTHLMTLP